MAEIWEIEEVKIYETERGALYLVAVVGPGNNRQLHAFDDDVLEGRIAEYGLDPNDLDTVIDIVLHESRMLDFSDPRNSSKDPAAKAGKKSPATRPWGRLVSVGDMVPTTVANAESTQQAREAHLLRIEEVKNSIQFVKPKGKPDPLKVVKDNAQIDLDRIKARQSYIQAVRAPRLQEAKKAQEAKARNKATVTLAQVIPLRRPVPSLPDKLPKDDTQHRKVHGNDSE